jgi:hypothetical protein
MNNITQELVGSLAGLLEQVYQMRGMFPDEDRTIANAVKDAEDALKEYWKMQRR